MAVVTLQQYQRLYVDDTELLLRAKFPMDSDETFILLTQKAVVDWGLLSQAIGSPLNKKNAMSVSILSSLSEVRWFSRKQENYL